MKKHLKALTVSLCAIALIVASIAATMAYLSTKTEPAEHTFTAGNINIALNDPAEINEKMMPGVDITTVDRKVIVKANSEQCYLFVKLTKLNNFDTFLTYTIADGWTPLNGNNDVYYRVVDFSAEEQGFNVFAKFTAKAECTKADYDAIQPDKKPNITLTAYAVQHVGIADEAAAWEIANGLDPSN